MTTTARKNKNYGVLTEIVPAVRQLKLDVYIKVMERRLTTKDHTGQVVSVTSQVVWSVVEQIANANPSVVDPILRIFRL